jgi:hypothetical protein
LGSFLPNQPRATHESISPPNFINAQRHKHKVNGAKILFCFRNISAKISPHILGCTICAERHILAHFCQMPLLLKAPKISSQKLLCFGTKYFGEINARTSMVQGSLL